MNILILTPDRVGSTLLQRMITVYMNDNSYDKPVINLHELSNGVIKYYSDVFKQEVLGKHDSTNDWGYWQTLPEVTNLLKESDHYVTSRLAHYHLKKRNDSMRDQTDFFKYLNDNFYIISCRRESVFEHALSWGIKGASSKLNVYSHEEKIEVFSQLYKDRITIPIESFTAYLDTYKEYKSWSTTYFDIRDVFMYERDMPNINNFIHNLDCFSQKDFNNWEDISGLNWRDWNRCHHLISDLTVLPNLLEDNSTVSSNSLPAIINQLPAVEQEFVQKNAITYIKSTNKIKELVEKKILVTGIPIKLQTLVGKKMIIKNFDECVYAYNDWADKNDYPIIESNEEIINQAYNELKHWYDEVPDNKFLE